MLHFGSILRSPPDRDFTCIDFCNHGNQILVGSSLGTIFLIKLHSDGTTENPRQIRPPADNKGLQSPITSILTSPCQRYVAAGTAAGSVVVLSIDNSKPIELLYNHEEHNGCHVLSLAWRADSQRLYSGASNGQVVELNTSLSSAPPAVNFLSKVFTKETKSICKCSKAIHQLSCSVVDNTSVVIDLLIVSSGSHAFLFQTNRTNPSKKTIMREISKVKLDGGKGLKDQTTDFTPPIDIVTGSCFSSTIIAAEPSSSSSSSSSSPFYQTKNIYKRKLAHSILVSRASTDDAMRISINHVNGEELYMFDIMNVDGATNVIPYPTSFRILKELDHNSYKSMILGISDQRDLFSVNLQNSTLERIKHFHGNIYDCATSDCRILTLSKDPSTSATMIDFFYVFTSVTINRPMKVFTTKLHIAMIKFQRTFRNRYHTKLSNKTMNHRYSPPIEEMNTNTTVVTATEKLSSSSCSPTIPDRSSYGQSGADEKEGNNHQDDENDDNDDYNSVVREQNNGNHALHGNNDSNNDSNETESTNTQDRLELALLSSSPLEDPFKAAAASVHHYQQQQQQQQQQHRRTPEGSPNSSTNVNMITDDIDDINTQSQPQSQPLVTVTAGAEDAAAQSSNAFARAAAELEADAENLEQVFQAALQPPNGDCTSISNSHDDLKDLTHIDITSGDDDDDNDNQNISSTDDFKTATIDTEHISKSYPMEKIESDMSNNIDDIDNSKNENNDDIDDAAPLSSWSSSIRQLEREWLKVWINSNPTFDNVRDSDVLNAAAKLTLRNMRRALTRQSNIRDSNNERKADYLHSDDSNDGNSNHLSSSSLPTLDETAITNLKERLILSRVERSLPTADDSNDQSDNINPSSISPSRHSSSSSSSTSIGRRRSWGSSNRTPTRRHSSGNRDGMTVDHQNDRRHHHGIMRRFSSGSTSNYDNHDGINIDNINANGYGYTDKCGEATSSSSSSSSFVSMFNTHNCKDGSINNDDNICDINEISNIPTISNDMSLDEYKPMTIIDITKVLRRAWHVNGVDRINDNDDNEKGEVNEQDNKNSIHMAIRKAPPANCYDVELDCPYGFGLGLIQEEKSGLLVVNAFNTFPNGDIMPAQACGCIALGDMLMEIDEVKLWEIMEKYQETNDNDKNIDCDADKIITILKETEQACRHKGHARLRFQYRNELMRYTSEGYKYIDENDDDSGDDDNDSSYGRISLMHFDDNGDDGNNNNHDDNNRRLSIEGNAVLTLDEREHIDQIVTNMNNNNNNNHHDHNDNRDIYTEEEFYMEDMFKSMFGQRQRRYSSSSPSRNHADNRDDHIDNKANDRQAYQATYFSNYKELNLYGGFSHDQLFFLKPYELSNHENDNDGYDNNNDNNNNNNNANSASSSPLSSLSAVRWKQDKLPEMLWIQLNLYVKSIVPQYYCCGKFTSRLINPISKVESNLYSRSLWSHGGSQIGITKRITAQYGFRHLIRNFPCSRSDGSSTTGEILTKNYKEGLHNYRDDNYDNGNDDDNDDENDIKRKESIQYNNSIVESSSSSNVVEDTHKGGNHSPSSSCMPLPQVSKTQIASAPSPKPILSPLPTTTTTTTTTSITPLSKEKKHFSSPGTIYTDQDRSNSGRMVTPLPSSSSSSSSSVIMMIPKYNTQWRSMAPLLLQLHISVNDIYLYNYELSEYGRKQPLTRKQTQEREQKQLLLQQKFPSPYYLNKYYSNNNDEHGYSHHDIPVLFDPDLSVELLESSQQMRATTEDIYTLQTSNMPKNLFHATTHNSDCNDSDNEQISTDEDLGFSDSDESDDSDVDNYSKQITPLVTTATTAASTRVTTRSSSVCRKGKTQMKWVPALELQKVEANSGLFEMHEHGAIPDLDDLLDTYITHVEEQKRHMRLSREQALDLPPDEKKDAVRDFLAKAYFGDDDEGSSHREFSSIDAPSTTTTTTTTAHNGDNDSNNNDNDDDTDNDIYHISPASSDPLPPEEPTILCSGLISAICNIAFNSQQILSILKCWLELFTPSSIPLYSHDKKHGSNDNNNNNNNNNNKWNDDLNQTMLWRTTKDLCTFYLIMNVNRRRIVSKKVFSSRLLQEWSHVSEIKSLSMGVDLSINALYNDNHDRQHQHTNDSDDEFIVGHLTAFIVAYGRYLNLDMCVAFCCVQGEKNIQQRPYLWEAIRLLLSFANEDEHYTCICTSIESLMKNRLSPLSMLSAVQFFEYINDCVDGKTGKSKKPSLNNATTRLSLSNKSNNNNSNNSNSNSSNNNSYDNYNVCSHTGGGRNRPLFSHKNSRIIICMAMKYVTQILDKELRLGLEILAMLFEVGIVGWMVRSIHIIGSPLLGCDYHLGYQCIPTGCDEFTTSMYYIYQSWHVPIKGHDIRDPNCQTLYSRYSNYLKCLLVSNAQNINAIGYNHNGYMENNDNRAYAYGSDNYYNNDDDNSVNIEQHYGKQFDGIWKEYMYLLLLPSTDGLQHHDTSHHNNNSDTHSNYHRVMFSSIDDLLKNFDEITTVHPRRVRQHQNTWIQFTKLLIPLSLCQEVGYYKGILLLLKDAISRLAVSVATTTTTTTSTDLNDRNYCHDYLHVQNTIENAIIMSLYKGLSLMLLVSISNDNDNNGNSNDNNIDSNDACMNTQHANDQGHVTMFLRCMFFFRLALSCQTKNRNNITHYFHEMKKICKLLNVEFHESGPSIEVDNDDDNDNDTDDIRINIKATHQQQSSSHLHYPHYHKDKENEKENEKQVKFDKQLHQEIILEVCTFIGSLLDDMINRLVLGQHIVVNSSSDANATAAIMNITEHTMITLIEACICAVGLHNTIRISRASSYLSRSLNIRQLMSISEQAKKCIL